MTEPLTPYEVHRWDQVQCELRDCIAKLRKWRSQLSDEEWEYAKSIIRPQLVDRTDEYIANILLEGIMDNGTTD